MLRPETLPRPFDIEALRADFPALSQEVNGKPLVYLDSAASTLKPQAVIDALKLAARTEALILDPVYSGKAMKGLIDLCAKGAFKGETVVFLHTGGAQGLFGYQSELEGKLA